MPCTSICDHAEELMQNLEDLNERYFQIEDRIWEYQDIIEDESYPEWDRDLARSLQEYYIFDQLTVLSQIEDEYAQLEVTGGECQECLDKHKLDDNRFEFLHDEVDGEFD